MRDTHNQCPTTSLKTPRTASSPQNLIERDPIHLDHRSEVELALERVQEIRYQVRSSLLDIAWVPMSIRTEGSIDCHSGPITARPDALFDRVHRNLHGWVGPRVRSDARGFANGP